MTRRKAAMKMSEIKLELCPFCGSDDITLWRDPLLEIVGGRCNACGADSGNRADGRTKQEAANAWNRRADTEKSRAD